MKDLIYAIIFFVISIVNGYLFVQSPNILAGCIQLIYFVLAVIYLFRWQLFDKG